MKHILLLGNGPPPDNAHKICSAVGLRTQQFLEPLQKTHRVKKFLITPDTQEGGWGNESTFCIGRQNSKLISSAQNIFSQQHFDIVIAVNTFPAYIAAQILDTKTPFWADLNGWIMAEMQAQASELGHNHYLAHGWKQEQRILLRADHISTVSRPQRFAVLGELAALGRLTKEHFAEDFVHVIPNTPKVLNLKAKEEKRKDVFRGNIVPEDAFVITQIGGFNNWLDEQTLFAAVEQAMAADKKIHFISTGGSIENIAENTFSRFQKQVTGSAYANRFHLLGWIENAQIPDLYRASNVGILVDKMCVETETGARNRLNEMMRYGLPIVTTRGSEITHDIERWGCGKVVESGNALELKNAIVELQQDPKLCTKFSHAAQTICQTELSAEKTVAPLFQYLEQSEQQILHQYRISFTQKNLVQQIKTGGQFLRERGPKQFLKKLWQSIWQQ